ncbi:MAG: translation initiation factor IF-2 [Odoribacteraceae bacterium]|jgi:translation initiation factor IF-2|nr:translation initiation factor IF-2 [Odoribacteraceae bacterium]
MVERLSKVAREFNVGHSTIVEYLQEKGIQISSNPNTKLTEEQFLLVEAKFSNESKARGISIKSDKYHRPKKETISIDKPASKESSKFISVKDEVKNRGIKIVGHINQNRVQPSQEKVEEQEVTKMEESLKKSLEEPLPTPVENVFSPPVEIPVSVEEKSVEESPVEEIVVTPKTVEELPVEEPLVEEQPVIEQPVEETPPVVTATSPQEDKEESKEENKAEETEKRADAFTLKVVGTLDLDSINDRTRPRPKSKAEKKAERKERERKEQERREQERKEQEGGKKELKKQQATATPPVPDETTRKSIILAPPKSEKSTEDGGVRKKKRNRISVSKDEKVTINASGTTPRQEEGNKKLRTVQKKKVSKVKISEEEIEKQVKDTRARMEVRGKTKTSKHRKDKREAVHQRRQAEIEMAEMEKRVLKVTEFVTVSELATMMDIPPTSIISACMSLGHFVGINQRLDAEIINIVAEEFGFTIEFVSVDIQEAIEEEEEDKLEDMEPRPPIVTVMGHVDHGKTSLLDYIRKANVIAGEAGGITQHIGAYSVMLSDGRTVTFLDTPGHEAFTAMRARGAQVTDIAIIIVSADDHVMPQTVEAINHASAAGVPIVFAINKIDRPGANPEKIKEELAGMNYLVEDWGGKYQSQEISAKQGLNIEELLEKVLLEAGMLELKASPRKKATGSTIESSLDKGRGYVATILVQNGTLRVGDVVLAGQYFGHVKAMFNERGQKLEEAGPSTPVLILGLDGAPQAGDKFNVMDNEKDARALANKRKQLQREQGLRTQKHITLDEIGRRIAIGNFQELNIIVKGDVDGSIEALSDSLIKLSTREIQVNVIHKAVGQISEGDIMLAAASNAIIVGFQVRPSLGARKLAEKEQIDIRLYSIIYTAIEEIKSAMEGMLSPEIKEEITSTVEVMETFKISKVGTVAGCIVRDGKITRSTKVRVIRDGIVIYSGELGSLKRFKDDVKEVAKGFECGLNIQNFNDLQQGDFIESFEEIAIKKTL